MNYVGECVDGIDQTPVDPARTCAEEWRFEGLRPPELTAYWNASGEIVVVRSDRDVPASWRPYVYEPLAPAVLELQTSLVDHVDGLQSDCFDAEDGRAFVEGELQRLGLDDWRVTVRNVAAARGCAGALPHLDDEEVEIIPGLDYEWSVNEIVDADADCTRVDINVDGPQVPIDLRGPAEVP
jgi:hypothetical protein